MICDKVVQALFHHACSRFVLQIPLACSLLRSCSSCGLLAAFACAQELLELAQQASGQVKSLRASVKSLRASVKSLRARVRMITGGSVSCTANAKEWH